MKLNKKSILTLCLMLLLTASLIMNIIALVKINSMEILGYSDLRLSKLIYGDVTKMYADSGYDPYIRGEFYDEEFLEELIELLSLGCFQEVRKPPLPLNHRQMTGLLTDPYVIFYTEDHEFIISIYLGTVSITVDGEAKYYNSNITSKLSTTMLKFIENEIPRTET